MHRIQILISISVLIVVAAAHHKGSFKGNISVFFSFSFSINYILCFADGSSTNIVCCDQNMEPNDCVNDCNARTCANLRKKPDPDTCSKKCYADNCQCKSGLYLNDCNVCVPENRCDEDTKRETPIECPGRHEELVPCFYPSYARNCWNVYNHHISCTPNSPRDVDLYDTPDANASWPEGQCILNVCDCSFGYFRNKCGICVQYNQCDEPCNVDNDEACSDPHEKRYDQWRECEERTCINLKYPMERDDTNERVHKNKCDCKHNYYRDNCGRCVPKHECDNQRPCKCTNPCKKPNQVPRCINSCMKRTCAKALSIPLICKKHCYYDCDCDDATWLNSHGHCVRKVQCTRKDIRATAQTVRDADVKADAESIFERPEPLPWDF